MQDTDHEKAMDKRRRTRQIAEAGAADQTQAATGLEAMGHEESMHKRRFEGIFIGAGVVDQKQSLQSRRFVGAILSLGCVARRP